MANDVSYPHVIQSTAAVKKFEPVVASNYNAHIVLMGTLKDTLGDYAWLSEYIKSVSGLFIEKSGGTIEGGYKMTKFRYDSNEKETYYDVEMAFFNFLDNDSKMLVYNALAALSRQKYNPLTGEKTLKSHYADAAIVVEKFNRNGVIFWRRIGHNFFIMNDLPDQMADYTSHDMQELSITANVDYVSDVTNDPRISS
jgi:hypothetical protein